MTKIEAIDEYADDMGVEDLLLLGEDPSLFEEAVIGIAHRFGMTPSVCYDMDKVIEIFAQQFSEDIEEGEDPYEMAIEWFEYNVIGGWLGDTTPLYIKTV